ncbi:MULTISPECIES: immunity 42 family protein [Kluyvera]|uniref:Uncharacterized protein n=1 Tax=Kluyvera genomosp. 3 TaxID=2774055 RepID=A0A6G9RGL5_9ENTR|nr:MULTISPECIES: immunity 42 family protein [Kluyvera]QIR26084.1 hypothetical protein GY169_04365 [Kluyvera genomosp. 3]
MIFGDPYRFAIWVDPVPEWSESFLNGFVYIFIKGKMFPDDIRTSTLSVDVFEIIDESSPLVSFPVNEDIFNLKADVAFSSLMSLAYPESSSEDEYPDQKFDFCINIPNVNASGMQLFAVSNGIDIKILGAKTEQLVENLATGKNEWEEIDDVLAESVVIPNVEIDNILSSLKEYILPKLKR